MENLDIKNYTREIVSTDSAGEVKIKTFTVGIEFDDDGDIHIYLDGGYLLMVANLKHKKGPSVVMDGIFIGNPASNS